MAKRVFDVIIVIVFLPLLLPVVVILSVMILLKLGKPVIFSQERPGLDGRPFRMIKFRTMTNQCDVCGNLMSDAQRYGVGQHGKEHGIYMILKYQIGKW